MLCATVVPAERVERAGEPPPPGRERFPTRAIQSLVPLGQRPLEQEGDIGPAAPLIFGHVAQCRGERAVGAGEISRRMPRQAAQRFAPPEGRAAASRDVEGGVVRLMLDQVADPLADDPFVPGQRLGGARERREQLHARVADPRRLCRRGVQPALVPIAQAPDELVAHTGRGSGQLRQIGAPGGLERLLRAPGGLEDGEGVRPVVSPRATEQPYERKNAHHIVPHGIIRRCFAARELDAASAGGNVGPMLPREWNAAHWFVDRHIEEGRDACLAILHEGRRLSYGEVYTEVNRLGNALRRLGVAMEQRVVLLLHDSPEFVWSFWGALKIGAIPIPTNTLLKPRDLEYILRDSRAAVVIASEPLVPAIEEIRPRVPSVTHVVVAGDASGGQLSYAELVGSESAELAPAATTKDDVAFWLYTSGTTGTPKAAVHLQHDMLVCCEGFGKHVLEIQPEDRTFSVAKLFFAYGLGNALYFPFHVGASTVLYPGRPEPKKVFEVIAREGPTVFYAVPTAYAALLQVPDAERAGDLASVRICSSAGEPLPKAIYERWLEKFGIEILDGIGSTEMCHTFIANRRGKVRPGSSGTLVPGYDARLVDDEGRDLDQHRVPLAREEFIHLAAGLRALTVVVAHDLRGPLHDDEVVRLDLVVVPPLHDVRIRDRDVHLPELRELRPVGADHLHQISSLVVDRLQRPHLDAVDEVHALPASEFAVGT